MPNDSTRRNITETTEWTPGIYQLEENDVAEAGPDGILNQPIKDLAARTNYLKKLIEQLQSTVPGTAEYENIMNQLRQMDVGKLSRQVQHSERLISNIYLTLKANNLDPQGYDWALVEDFEDGAKDIDQSLITVTSVVSGDDSIDVEDASGLLIGSTYQLTDGEHTEEVQIKSINISGNVNRVILKDVVKNQFTNGRTKLYRSSAILLNGKAYGGGNTKSEIAKDVAKEFTGSSEKQEMEKTINFTDYGSFDVKNATIKDGKLTTSSLAYGIVLNATGGGAGDWRRINVDGDDLKQSDLAS